VSPFHSRASFSKHFLSKKNTLGTYCILIKKLYGSFYIFALQRFFNESFLLSFIVA